MKPGRVVSIRINPKDCMSAVDIATRSGLVPRGISFAQVVSIALATACETFRTHNIIPERQGFEYGPMMEPFKDQPSKDKGRTRKLDITSTMALTTPASHVRSLTNPVDDTPKAKMLRAKLDELEYREEADPLNFTEADKVLKQAVALEWCQVTGRV